MKEGDIRRKAVPHLHGDKRGTDRVPGQGLCPREAVDRNWGEPTCLWTPSWDPLGSCKYIQGCDLAVLSAWDRCFQVLPVLGSLPCIWTAANHPDVSLGPILEGTGVRGPIAICSVSHLLRMNHPLPHCLPFPTLAPQSSSSWHGGLCAREGGSGHFSLNLSGGFSSYSE